MIVPNESGIWQYVESILRDTVARCSIKRSEYLIVSTELFKRSMGEVTDIVEKEMCTFDDAW